METILNLQLNVDSSTVRQSLLDTKLIKLTKECIITKGPNTIYVYPPKPKGKKAISRGYIRGDDIYFTLKTLKLLLPKVVIKGFNTVSRSILNRVFYLNYIYRKKKKVL